MTYISDLNLHALPKNSDAEYYMDFFDIFTLEVDVSFRPENWHVELNIREPDTVAVDISFSALDMSGATIVSGHDFIGPWRHGWLLRQGWTPISAGPITSVRTRKGSDFMSVGGKDWLHYFQRRQFPFNGDPTVPGNEDGMLEAFTGSKLGFGYYVENADIATHLDNIISMVLNKDYSFGITYALAPIGKAINYEIPIGDQRFISDMIGELSDVAPGFDFETTWDMVFQIASPYFYGDPTTFDITDSTDSHWAFVFDDSDDAHTPFDVEFGNEGPISTHVAGFSSSEMAVTKGYGPGQEQFSRLDASYDFGSFPNRDALDARTSKQLAYNLQPVHEIPLTVLASQITNFWTIFKPGRAIFVDQELVFHRIDSGQRIVQMTVSDAESIGEPTVEIGLNQIYDTSDNIGAVEG